MDKRITSWLPDSFTEEARMSKANKKHFAKKAVLDELKEIANRCGVGNGGTFNFLSPVDLSTSAKDYQLTAIEFNQYGSGIGILADGRKLDINNSEEWRLRRIMDAMTAQC